MDDPKGGQKVHCDVGVHIIYNDQKLGVWLNQQKMIKQSTSGGKLSPAQDTCTEPNTNTSRNPNTLPQLAPYPPTLPQLTSYLIWTLSSLVTRNPNGEPVPVLTLAAPQEAKLQQLVEQGQLHWSPRKGPLHFGEKCSESWDRCYNLLLMWMFDPKGGANPSPDSKQS